MMEMIREGCRHLYHGFRLFGVNTKLAWTYSRQLKRGVALTRRERQLLEESTRDLLRLVPFSVFIIVPLGELLLPVALKMFPGLIPSTFETESQGRNRVFGESMKTLRARQRIMEYMSATALATFSDEQQAVIRRCALGETITPKDIRLVAPYFARDGPFSVYKIPDNIAVGQARIVGEFRWYHSLMPTKLSARFLRRAIIRHYHKVREDDRLLRVEGMDDLTKEELVKANLMRGMRWTEKPETLRVQLEWWSALARDPNVPYNTLFWVKPVRYSLKKSMNNLPVAQRSQLLGIQNLPESVRASLETLCNTVDTVAKIDEGPTTADSIAERVESITDSAKKGDEDIDLAGLQVQIGEYLTEENVTKMYEKLSSGKLEEEDSVLTSDVIEYIGHATHNSTHSVSILFDAFDYDAGSKPITDKALLAIGARCRATKDKKDAGAGAADEAGAKTKAKE